MCRVLKLPGEPSNIVALGGAKAEMTTSSGAIYYTKNAGMNWSAQVRPQAPLSRAGAVFIPCPYYDAYCDTIGFGRADETNFCAILTLEFVHALIAMLAFRAL